MKQLCLFLLLLFAIQIGYTQEAASDSSTEKIKFIHPYKFWQPSPVLNKPRVITTSVSLGLIYGVGNIYLSQAWYKDFPKSKFHSFNDAGEWLQIDKVGHATSAYFINRLGYDVYHWSGLKPNSALWAGVGVAQAYQLVVEIQDGFSDKWGFSWSDIGANLSGSALYVGQHYLWGEQRFVLKESAWPAKHPDFLQERTDNLFGPSFSEQILKDYNATTFWLTASLGSFIKGGESKFPNWIGVSLGYGGKGMYGGFENRWCNVDGVEIHDCPASEINTDAVGIDRTRQFYLSLDIDFTKIEVKSDALKAFLEIINIIKIPFPALEVNTQGDVNWHWLMF
ncbi:MAG: DUF2279 domain-containing protein [Chitinophagales bacterium]